jgi:hypothetical protein
MTLKGQRDIIQAAIDGKEIEYSHKASAADGEWLPCHYNSNLIAALFDFANLYYRVKPQPKYKPYSAVKGEWVGKSVIDTDYINRHICLIVAIDDTRKRPYIYIYGNGMQIDLKEFFRRYTWLDGMPCGEVDNN